MPKIPASAGSKPVARTGGRRTSVTATAGAAPPAETRRPVGRARVPRKALTQFTTQLSTLQDAGLPIVRSLKILEGQMQKGPFKAVLGDVKEEVESGSPLSDAMGRHPGVFDGLYTNMVKAGEAGGVLDVILARLSGFMEKAERLRKKIKGAMMYPLVVGIVTFSILMLIMIFVVPKFEQVFKSMPGLGELPALTQMLQDFSRFILDRWYILLLALVLLIAAWKGIGMTKGGRRFFDRMKLRLPLLGGLVRKVVVARFARTFGTLISSGVPILEALEICRNTAGNVVLAEALEKVRDSISEGGTIAEPLGEAQPLFDDIVVNMVDVGEETGELDKMLIRVADNYDEEVDVAVGALVSIIEPLLIVFLGGAVFIIVLGLFLPLLKLIQNLDQRQA